jgi:c-di-GMP-binding flagellar brake protein YcgR
MAYRFELGLEYGMSFNQVALRIERFHDDEDIEFRIKSKREMLSILQSIADQGSHVALFYGGGQSFILTNLLGVNEHGIWLDVGPFPPENKLLLLSDKITFVSVHQNVKIQFVANDIENDLFENNEAFYMELPDYLLRIQRREFFRTSIPSSTPIKCIIPIQPENPDDPVIMRAVPLVDISGGGVGLLCGEHEATLLPKKVFPNCQISIPEVGILTVTIEARNGINFTTLNKVVHKRVGCRFIDMDNQMNILLQLYITRLQSESLVRL